MVTPVAMEPLLGYHPCSIGFLTSRRDPAVGQCQTGSLTGAVASERVSEAPKGSLRMDGNHPKSAKAEGSLTATPTGGAGTKVGLSDPVVLSGNAIAQRIKSYPGDNRLITPRVHIDGVVWHLDVGSSHPGAVEGQGLGCSPIKAVRELGSERRETVLPLSGAGVGYLRGAVQYEMTGMDGPLVHRLDCQVYGRVAKPGRDKR